MNKPYSILLYYCYTPIADPEAFREEHHLLCLELNLLGRIIISKEGLNGTVSGLKADCDKYMEIVKADPRFAKVDFKVDESDKHAFAKLHVRTKAEIVHSGIMETLVWLRVPGDVVFSIGAVFLALYAAKLLLNRGKERFELQPEQEAA